MFGRRFSVLIDSLSQLIKVQKFTQVYTVSANSYSEIRINVSINDYKPIGIVGSHTGNTEVFNIGAFMIDESTAYFAVSNKSNIQLSPSISTYIAYIKN